MILALNRNLLHLSLYLGETNPITFGAVATGFVALAGLAFLISRDEGEIFDIAGGDGLKGIVNLGLFTFGGINIVWEQLRVLLDVFAHNLLVKENALGRENITDIGFLDGRWVGWFPLRASDGVAYTEVLNIGECVRAVFSPGIVLLMFATSVSVAFSSALETSLRPMPRQLRPRLQYIIRRIDQIDKVETNLQKLNAVDPSPKFDVFRDGLILLIEPLLLVVVLQAFAAYRSLPAELRCPFGILSVFAWLVLTIWAFTEKASIISGRAFVDRFSTIYFRVVYFMATVMICMLPALYSNGIASLLGAYAIFRCFALCMSLSSLRTTLDNSLLEGE